jgi:hypothetical protein
MAVLVAAAVAVMVLLAVQVTLQQHLLLKVLRAVRHELVILAEIMPLAVAVAHLKSVKMVIHQIMVVMVVMV